MPLTSTLWCDIEQRLTPSLTVQKRIRFIHSTLLFMREMIIPLHFLSKGTLNE